MLKFFLTFLIISTPLIGVKLPDITPKQTTAKMKEIMKEHITFKEMTPTLAKRTLNTFVEDLDPNKTYFIESDVQKWTNPSDHTINQVVEGFEKSEFSIFSEIQDKMIQAIKRRQLLEQHIDLNALPEHVNPKEFKDMKWAKTEDELLSRLTRIKGLQVETSMKLAEEAREKALQRIAKNQSRIEKELTAEDPKVKQQLILTEFMKAVAGAMDTHTAYFTPDETAQFLINVQQRLFGIGAQLRDDLNGFTIIKLLEGGPAALSKELKANDRIIAVNGEPVVGMDIIDAVDLIRGPEGSNVTLTIIRKDENSNDRKLDVKIVRAEVILKETRYESSWEPFGDGVIAYLRLLSFYQDPDSNSADDLRKAFEEIEKEHRVKGVILDMRNNPGGFLSQAVAVTGLFISKGVVVTIIDSSGQKQILRETDGKTLWEGPLVVLINRASASAAEIVAQTLQDYGRAVVIGDDHSYGKGSFQTFTLNTSPEASINPQGEYKVTRGRYYTVSGKSPQQTGVISDIIVPGPLSESEIGEKYAKYPLETDKIAENFDDDLSDIPKEQRQKVRLLYKFNLQPKLTTYSTMLATLKKNSNYRIEKNKDYQTFLKEIRKEEPTEEEVEENFGKNDQQLNESYNIIKDMIVLSH
jgi:carboxyl-terminal processing protease